MNNPYPDYASTPRPRFWMTDAQMRRLYRQADNKVHQVRVLAELNARSIKDTVDKLESIGCEVDRQKVTAIHALGVNPFGQPYRDFNGGEPTEEQKRLARWCNMKAVHKTTSYENYLRNQGGKYD